MALALGEITASLGPDAQKLWLTSFTVDEHEGYALLYRALGGRLAPNAAWLAFHRRAFRRAGSGVIPRQWLHPVDAPSESPLATYHPKVFLAQTINDEYILIISTANLATDDLRRSRNLTARFMISAQTAKSVTEWIKCHPIHHRALCLSVSDNGCKIIRPKDNCSTIRQITPRLVRCKRCRSTNARAGEWIVAAPFWSPSAITELLSIEPHGRVEAYFRIRNIWDQLAAALQNVPDQLRRVTAYELRKNGDPSRWHHKVLGWRCCQRPGFRSAFYLGSANATVCGLFGRNGKAINWEAGVLWLGDQALWKYAKSAAHAGFSPAKLGAPYTNDLLVPNLDDELGPADTDELDRVFAAFAARCVHVAKTRYVTRRSTADKIVRVLGHHWRLSNLVVGIEQSNQFRELGRLRTTGTKLFIPKNSRAHIRAQFCVADDKSGGAEYSPFETTIDLIELDPEPPSPKVTTRTSIAAACAGLLASNWDSNGGLGQDRVKNGLAVTLSDIRFPFADLFSLRRSRPGAAKAWLDRLVKSEEPALARLPQHWRLIAKGLVNT